MLAKTDVITTHAATLKVNSAGEPEGWRGIPMSRPMPVIPAAANGPITAYQAKIRKNDLSGLSVVFMRPIAKVSDGSQRPMTFDLSGRLNGWLRFAAPTGWKPSRQARHRASAQERPLPDSLR